MAHNYIIKFYNSKGGFYSDWPVHIIKIFATYDQAERKANELMRSHANWYNYKIIEK